MNEEPCDYRIMILEDGKEGVVGHGSDTRRSGTNKKHSAHSPALPHDYFCV
jgi:hypothetical protein